MVFSYYRPKSLEEMVANFNQNESVFFLAGGTDLLVKCKENLMKPDKVIDLKEISELKGIHMGEGSITIGANVTHSEISANKEINDLAYILSRASELVGSPQIRNLGTIGGNICNASPAADTVPALLVLDAELTLFGKDGEEKMPLEDFFHLPGKPNIKNGQVVCSVKIKTIQKNQGAAFEKIGRRKSLAISVVNGASFLHVEDSIIKEARISVGSVAAKTLRFPEVENWLVGQKASSQIFAQAGKKVEDIVNPIDDIRSTAFYRKSVTSAVVERTLEVAFNRIGVK